MLRTLTNQASVWIFQANNHLNSSQIEYINATLEIFVPDWVAHGVSLKADFEIVKDLFVIIGVDESQTSASGCSKDALMRQIKVIGDRIGIDFFDRLTIAYANKEEKIILVNMMTFKDLVQKGIICQNTVVYNNLVTTKEELIENWEVKLANSWHANLVPIL